MSGSLQDHRLKDDEPLQVTQYVFHQSHNKVSPNLPTWHIVAPGGHDHEVTPPPRTSLIFTNASMKESARVGVKSVPIDLLESEVLRGRGVARQITPLSLLVFLIQKLVAPVLSLLPAGLRLGRSGEVTGWPFPFLLPLCTRTCLPHLHSSVPPSSIPVPFCSFGCPCLC